MASSEKGDFGPLARTKITEIHGAGAAQTLTRVLRNLWKNVMYIITNIIESVPRQAFGCNERLARSRALLNPLSPPRPRCCLNGEDTPPTDAHQSNAEDSN